MGIRRFAHASGSGAIAMSLSHYLAYGVKEVRLTLGAVSADLDDFEVRIDSELGADFDHLLCAPDPLEDLSVVKSFRYADPVPPVIFPGDVLEIIWPNAGSVDWAIEVIAE